MSLFNSLEPPEELIKFQLVEDYLADQRPDRIFTATGAYKNDQGQTPRLRCVRLAEERLRQRDCGPDYLEPAGYAPFCEAMEHLLLADRQALLPVEAAPPNPRPIRTIHTPGGTAALRLGADLIQAVSPQKTIWVSDPTWGNHLKVFRAAGLSVKTYPWSVHHGILDVDHLLTSMETIPEGDVLMLQASTHNPTCVDLSVENWHQLAAIVAGRRLLPFFDVAFFGFTEGLQQDLAGLRTVLQTAGEAIIATSLSKSFAMYNRRGGTLSVSGESAAATENAFQHARHLVRSGYSNPPLEGAAVVAEILADRKLRSIWEEELEGIRDRMRDCREQLAKLLRQNGVDRDIERLTRERGLFTHFDLTPDQIAALRNDQAIYLSSSGWFNVTAITDDEIERFVRCVSAYLA